MQHAYASLVRSRYPLTGELTTSRCGRLEDAYYHAGYPLTGNVLLLTVALSAIPVLIGMFVACPCLVWACSASPRPTAGSCWPGEGSQMARPRVHAMSKRRTHTSMAAPFAGPGRRFGGSQLPAVFFPAGRCGQPAGSVGEA